MENIEHELGLTQRSDHGGNETCIKHRLDDTMAVFGPILDLIAKLLGNYRRSAVAGYAEIEVIRSPGRFEWLPLAIGIDQPCLRRFYFIEPSGAFLSLLILVFAEKKPCLMHVILFDPDVMRGGGEGGSQSRQSKKNQGGANKNSFQHVMSPVKTDGVIPAGRQARLILTWASPLVILEDKSARF